MGNKRRKRCNRRHGDGDFVVFAEVDVALDAGTFNIGIEFNAGSVLTGFCRGDRRDVTRRIRRGGPSGTSRLGRCGCLVGFVRLDGLGRRGGWRGCGGCGAREGLTRRGGRSGHCGHCGVDVDLETFAEVDANGYAAFSGFIDLLDGVFCRPLFFLGNLNHVVESLECRSGIGTG